MYVTLKEGERLTRHPIAMFIGVFTGAHGLNCEVYQAIVLPHAIKDLQEDYRHHVDGLHQFAHERHSVNYQADMISQLDCKLESSENIPGKVPRPSSVLNDRPGADGQSLHVDSSVPRNLDKKTEPAQ